MKKILLTLCVIAIAFGLASCKGKTKSDEPVNKNGALQPKNTASEAPNWKKIAENNELKIGVSENEGGFCDELIDAFTVELGIPVVKVKAGDDFKALLEDGTIDMYWGLYPKEASDSFDFTFSSPYLTSTAVLITLTGRGSEIASVGAVKYSAEATLAKEKGESVKLYENVGELRNALNAGVLDAILINNCDYESSEYFSSDSYELKDSSMYNLVIAFKDGHTDVAAEIDKTLAKIKASGVASEICEKWYGKDLISK